MPHRGAELLESMSAHERRWSYVDYATLAIRMGLNQEALYRRLRALSDLGMVEMMVRRKRRGVVDLAAWKAGAADDDLPYGSQVWLRPLASCVRRMDGTFALYVTKETQVAIEERNTRGGKRVGAGRKAKSKCGVTPLASTENQAEPGNQSAALLDLDLDLSGKDLTSPEGRAPEAGAAPDGAGISFSEPDVLDQLDLSAPGEARRRPILLRERGPRPSIPALDRPAVRYPEIGLRIPDITPNDRADPDRLAAAHAHRVALLARSFDVALRTVYKSGFSARDVTRLRSYPALLEAAAAFHEYSVAPTAWAIWRLTEAKGRGEPAWTIGRVMNAASLKRLRGWFKHSTKHALEGKQDWRPYHDEQRHRAREAELRWVWGEDPPMLSFPREYTEMRRKERKLGGAYVDPLHAWPTKDRR